MSGQISSNVGCKEMLVWKLTYAVTCSVLSQVLFLFIYLFILNFNIFQPVVWMQLTLSTATSLSTWLYLIPLATIIFAQGVICSKDYIYETTYRKTRFYKIISVFSVRNLVMVTLHILTGGLIVWLYLSLLGGKYGSLYVTCKNNYCLVEETFFMILNGMWVGLFYFIKNNLNIEKNFIFPIIQQRKFLTIKAMILSKLKQAGKEAIWPTLYFIVLYYYRGITLREILTYNFDLQLLEDPINIFDFVNSPLLIYSWMFSTLFIFTILSMRLYFEVFLMEQWSFPIESEFPDVLTLKEGLGLNTFPIIQHLACLDFYNLSIWDTSRRQQLFTLSQPGGHPHNWNRLLEEVLKLITEFSSDLNKATDAILCPESVVKSALKEKEIATSFSLENLKQEPLFPSAYSPIRNMALPKQEPPVSIIHVTYNKFLSDTKDFIKSITIDKINSFITKLKNRNLIKYFFGDVPESRIYFLLSKGQPIIWAIQGLSFLVASSITEDKYGIVQKDLPVITTSLVMLKLNLDKLNKVSFVNRKSMQGEPIRMQMKLALRTAVKRSLFNIANIFGNYLKYIPLSKEVHQHMVAFANYKEG